MATVDVELTIASARDLKNVNWKHGDLCAYATAWIEEGGPTRVRTKTDGSGDTAPRWDQKFTLPVPKQSLEQARLVVEIFNDKRGEDDEEEGGPAWRKKALVGRASLPLLEVVDAGAFDDVQDYTVKLKRPSGRPHGKLELTIRLRERRGAYGGAAAYGGQRDVQPPYPGYTSAYPAQPYGQGYPPQGYPAPSSAYPASSAYPYTTQPQPYAAYAAPQAYPSYAPSQPYGAPPPQGGSYGYQPYPTQYQQQNPPAQYQQQNPTPQYQQQNPPPQKTGSKFGGLGAGLAAGALAGAIGGIALDEFVDHKEDEAAEDQANLDAERYGDDRDDDYRDDDRDDDYGGGDDSFF